LLNYDNSIQNKLLNTWSLLFTGNITNVLDLNLYAYFLGEKYHKVINKRVSNTKINYIRINSVSKLHQK
jgi:hypothetical protein